MSNMLTTQSNLNKLAQFFKHLDQNHDGFLTLYDFEKGCKKIITKSASMTHEPDWNSLIHSLDVNSDGKIDFNEFVTAAYDRTSLLN